jgi:hypothetical protein
MTGITSDLSIITLNVNELNSPIKTLTHSNTHTHRCVGLTTNAIGLGALAQVVYIDKVYIFSQSMLYTSMEILQ